MRREPNPPPPVFLLPTGLPRFRDTPWVFFPSKCPMNSLLLFVPQKRRFSHVSLKCPELVNFSDSRRPWLAQRSSFPQHPHESIERYGSSLLVGSTLFATSPGRRRSTLLPPPNVSFSFPLSPHYRRMSSSFCSFYSLLLFAPTKTLTPDLVSPSTTTHIDTLLNRSSRLTQVPPPQSFQHLPDQRSGRSTSRIPFLFLGCQR